MLAGRVEADLRRPASCTAACVVRRIRRCARSNSSSYVLRANGGVKSIVFSPHGSLRVAGATASIASTMMRFGQVHHRAVVAVGLIELEHRELGIVPRADPLVAIDAAQLVDPLHAADQQPLEVQLQRDPQEQLHVERVVMRLERPGRGAAGDRVQRRPFDLDEALGWPACGGSTARSWCDSGTAAARPRCRSGRDSASAAAARDRPGRDACPAAARSTWSGSAASRRRSSARRSWCASARHRRR